MDGWMIVGLAIVLMGYCWDVAELKFCACTKAEIFSGFVGLVFYVLLLLDE